MEKLNNQEWKEIELGKIVKFDDGDWILSEDMDEAGNYGIIQLKHIGKGNFLEKPFQFITETKFKELKCLEILEGDLIISRMAEPICRSCIVPKLNHKLITAVDIAIARFPKEISVHYLNYLFNSNILKNRAEKYAAGTTRKRISKKNLEKIKIPLPFLEGKPNLEKQKQIVKTLEKLEELIEKREKTIFLLDEQLKSIFNEMFIGKGFKEVKLGKVFDIARGGSPRPIQAYLTKDEDGLNWIKIGDTKKNSKYIIKTEEKIKKDGLNKTRFVQEGDFILSNSMSFGRPYILKISGCIHDGWLVIKDTNNMTVNDYLYMILSSTFVYNQFLKSVSGSTVKNLKIDVVKKVKIPLPPIELQKEFASIVEKVEKLKEKQKQSLEKIEELFNSSLSKAFAGELI